MTIPSAAAAPGACWLEALLTEQQWNQLCPCALCDASTPCPTQVQLNSPRGLGQSHTLSQKSPISSLSLSIDPFLPSGLISTYLRIGEWGQGTPCKRTHNLQTSRPSKSCFFKAVTRSLWDTLSLTYFRKLHPLSLQWLNYLISHSGLSRKHYSKWALPPFCTPEVLRTARTAVWTAQCCPQRQGCLRLQLYGLWVFPCNTSVSSSAPPFTPPRSGACFSPVQSGPSVFGARCSLRFSCCLCMINPTNPHPHLTSLPTARVCECHFLKKHEIFMVTLTMFVVSISFGFPKLPENSMISWLVIPLILLPDTVFESISGPLKLRAVLLLQMTWIYKPVSKNKYTFHNLFL